MSGATYARALMHPAYIAHPERERFTGTAERLPTQAPNHLQYRCTPPPGHPLLDQFVRLLPVGGERAFIQDEYRSEADQVIKWKAKALDARIASKVEVEGTTRIEEVGRSRCRRLVTGQVTVDIPIIGGIAERAIAKATVDGMEREAAFAETFDWTTFSA